LGLLLVVLAGCAGSDAAPELTRASELPDERRALLAAYFADGPQWEARRDELDEDPELARWMCENLVLELFRAYDTANLAQLGETHGPFERARAELISFGATAVDVLTPLLAAKDGVVPVVAGDLLTAIGEPATAPVAGLLDGEQWRSRRVAAELLGELPHAGEDEAALQERLALLAREDPEWIVRAQAARSLGRRGLGHVTTEDARVGLVPVLFDKDPAVGREAATALGVLGDPAAVPALLNFYERGERSNDVRGQKAAQAALEAIAGKKQGTHARAWRNWWSDHRGELLGPGSDRPY